MKHFTPELNSLAMHAVSHSIPSFHLRFPGFPVYPPNLLSLPLPEEVWMWWESRRKQETMLKEAIANNKLDQQSIRPIFDSYRPYLAVDRADVLQTHADFYRAIAESDMELMCALWLNPKDANVNLNIHSNALSSNPTSSTIGNVGSKYEWDPLCFMGERESNNWVKDGPGGASVSGYDNVIALWSGEDVGSRTWYLTVYTTTTLTYTVISTHPVNTIPPHIFTTQSLHSMYLSHTGILAAPQPHLQVRNIRLFYQGDVAIVTSTVTGMSTASAGIIYTPYEHSKTISLSTLSS